MDTNFWCYWLYIHATSGQNLTGTSGTANTYNFGNKVTFVPNPQMTIAKAFVNVTGGDGDALADAVGDKLNYTVTIVDPLTGQNINGVTLASGANEVYNTSYTLTQDDLDKAGNAGSDGDIDNTATADSNETTPVDDSAEVPLVYDPQIDINKVTVYEGQTGDGLTGVIAGHSIAWNYTVTNNGNVSLSDITVRDTRSIATTGDEFSANPVLNGGFNIGDANSDEKLNPGETWQFSASGTAVVGSYENTGNASGTNGNTTVHNDDKSSYFGTADAGQITPTGTTAQQYINGTAQDFSEYYASQGGVVQYGVKGGFD